MMLVKDASAGTLNYKVLSGCGFSLFLNYKRFLTIIIIENKIMKNREIVDSFIVVVIIIPHSKHPTAS